MAEHETVGYLLEKCSYFQKIGLETVFFYDAEWENFLAASSADFWATLLLYLIIPPIFLRKYRNCGRGMQLTSVYGLKFCYIKLMVAALLGFWLTWLLVTAKWLGFLSANNDYSHMPIRDIMGCDAYGQLTIRGYLMMHILLQTAAWAAVATDTRLRCGCLLCISFLG